MEVGLKGTEQANDGESSARSTSGKEDKIAKLQHELDKYKREYKKIGVDSEAKIETLNAKISELSKQTEQAKTDLAFHQRLNKKTKEEVGLNEKQVENLNEKLKQKELAIETLNQDITKLGNSLKEKENDIAKAVG